MVAAEMNANEAFFASIENELNRDSKKFKAERAKMIYVQNKDFGSIKFAPVNIAARKSLPAVKCQVFEYNGYTNRFKDDQGNPRSLRYRFLLEKDLYSNECEIDNDLYNETKQLLWEMKDYINYRDGRDAYKAIQKVTYSLLYGYIVSTTVVNPNIVESINKPVCLVYNKQDVYSNLYDAIGKERQDAGGDTSWASQMFGASVTGRDGVVDITVKAKTNGMKGSDYTVSLAWNTSGARARQVIDPTFTVPETDYELFGDPIKDLCGYLCDKNTGNLWNQEVIQELHDQLVVELANAGIKMVKGDYGKVTFEGDEAIKAAKDKENQEAADNASEQTVAKPTAKTAVKDSVKKTSVSVTSPSAGSEDMLDIPF